MTDDAYEVCRHIRRYTQKNAYTPKLSELGCSDEFLEQLVANGVVQVLPLYEGGPPVCVVLTEKGFRMATVRKRDR